MTSRDLLRTLDARPFKLFVLKLADSRVFEVCHREMVMVGESSAVVATRNIRDAEGNPVTTDWRTIAINQICEIGLR